MIQFKALLVKELREAFRDKRALMAALLIGVMAPVMIIMMSKVVLKNHDDEPAIYVKIIGSEYAPTLISILASSNVLPLSTAPEEDKVAWNKRNIELIIPATFASDMVNGNIIDVVLRADLSEKANLLSTRRIREVISKFSNEVGAKRILMRGIDVKLLHAINIQEQDTSSPSSNSMFIITMLLIYLMIAAFYPGLSVAVDTSAGERERNVLELLLSQPVRTLDVVLAKMFTSSLVSVIAINIAIFLTLFSIGFIDLSKMGASFNLDAESVAIILILLIPLCFLASSLQLFLAFQAKSFKEAHTTATMVIALPTLVPFILTFIDNKPDWINWVPVSGQNMLIEKALKGLPTDWTLVGFVTLVTITITAIIVGVLAKRLQSEKMVLALS